MERSDGTIRFERMPDGRLAVRQGWNPSLLDRSERDLIVRELRSIADHVERDEFEDGRKYKHYPLSIPRSRMGDNGTSEH